MIRKKKWVWSLAAAAVFIAVFTVVFFMKSQRQKPYETASYAMGTYVQQTVYGEKGESAANTADKAIQNLENLISWRIETSDIARLNEASGTDWIGIDSKTVSLLAQSLDIAQKSEGAFDPTILPVSSLWDFGGNNQHVPSQQEIQKYDKYVDYKNLRINEKDSTASLKLHYMAVDLGAIGKGAACDVAVAAYRSAGAGSAIIAVGGSIGTYGKKPDGSPWIVAVRDPETSEQQVGAMGQISMEAGFVSTSGTYEKEFTENGVTYHHLLNPKTGFPENNGLVSVTVTAENGALSDGLSTACFILGKEKGMELLKQYHAGGIFVDSSRHVTVTYNLKNSFKLLNRQYTLAK